MPHAFHRLFLALSILLASCSLAPCALRADDPAAKDDSAANPATPEITAKPTFAALPAKDKNGRDIPPAATEKEVEMGNKASQRIEKDPKIKILDAKKDEKTKALYAKLNDMAQKIGKASARPLIEYKVKVIDDDTEINAFTLPNGSVYFFTGLLNLLSSDDEIAAVMAHEIGHNARMHVLRGDKHAKTLSLLSLAAILAALAGGREGANIAAFSQYALVGVMNGYSIEYEKEADSAGVDEMIRAGYNPSAMATVMQRFVVEEKRRPYVELGVYETHPAAPERVVAIERQIRAAGLPFNPRAVTGAPEALAVDQKDRVAVQFMNATLLEFASAPTAMQRAQQSARVLNELIRDNLKMYEVKAVMSYDNAAVLSARGTEIARVTPADAALQKLTPLECAQRWRENLKKIFWRETVGGVF